jgi:hypothetical protein
MTTSANGWLLILMIAAGCTATDRDPVAPSRGPLSAQDETAWIGRGGTTVQPFKVRLQQALLAGLAAGPEQAVDACRIEAPAIAAASGGPGVTVGRSSHRLRNPANAPRPWVQLLLDEFVAAPDRAAPRAIALPGGGVGYAEPIVAQPLCVTCHGNAIPPGVRARLAALYPGDEATGFAPGDLRGLFWVEFAPAAVPPR